MEGAILMTTKVYATEFMLRTLPAFTSVELSNLNVDAAFESMLVQEMKKDLIQFLENNRSKYEFCFLGEM